jgi:hypothetical protein
MIEPTERAAAAARTLLLARATRIGWLSVSLDVARLRLALRQFNPAQPRVPAGQPGGGRWMGEGDTASPAAAASPDRQVTSDAERTVETTRRADGTIATQNVLNRDGSAIRSEYGAGDGPDERHTVVLPDGTVRQFETTGDVQTIRDGNGEMLSRSRWTENGPVAEPASEQEATVQQVAAPALLLPLVQPAHVAAAAAAAATAAAGVRLLNWLSSRDNAADRPPIATFRARDYQDVDNLTSVTTRTREELSNICHQLEDVQRRTNRITEAVMSQRPGLSPSQFGTEVHTRLKAELDRLKDPNYRAEVSLLKSREAAYYSQRGSVRIDVYERASSDTACVYDIKTGQEGLSRARFREMYARAREVFDVSRVIVVEVRPHE